MNRQQRRMIQNSPMPMNVQTPNNPEMADEIDSSPVFTSMAQNLLDMRERQAMRWQYIYSLADEIDGQVTSPFILTIEQGTDFKCEWITASAFSYDSQNATDFPMPNSAGLTDWAGRGLSVRITDTNAGRDLTSGFVPWELISTPGYGMNFQHPYPFRYLFRRNNRIRFDIRNRDNANRAESNDSAHQFAIALLGYKILSPQ